jgi:hypothetical protein
VPCSTYVDRLGVADERIGRGGHGLDELKPVDHLVYCIRVGVEAGMAGGPEFH